MIPLPAPGKLKNNRCELRATIDLPVPRILRWYILLKPDFTDKAELQLLIPDLMRNNNP